MSSEEPPIKRSRYNLRSNPLDENEISLNDEYSSNDEYLFNEKEEFEENSLNEEYSLNEEDSFIVDDELTFDRDRIRNIIFDMIKNGNIQKELTNLTEDEYSLFECVNEYIKSNEITLKDILNADIPLKKKSRLLNLFKVLKQYEPSSLDYIHLQQEIKKVLKHRPHPDEEKIKKLINKDTDIRMSILNKNVNDYIKSQLYNLYLSYEKSEGSEAVNIKKKLDFALSLPYNIKNITDTNIRETLYNCKRMLDMEIYGMDNVKYKILYNINNRLNGDNKTSIALKGLPGSGKSHICSIIGKAIGLPTEFIYIGGMNDVSVLKGDYSLYVGASAGMILKAIQRMGCDNGIMVFDEIDKIADTNKGQEVSNSLIHITDYTTNSKFQDDYLDIITYDISKIWFMFTMNDENINPILKDRLNIINIEKYSKEDLYNIVNKYTIPNKCKKLNINVSFTKGSIYKIIGYIKRDTTTGLRELNNIIEETISIINLERIMNNQNNESYVIDENNVNEYLKDLINENEVSIKNMYI